MAKKKKPSAQIEKFRLTFFEECAERLSDIETVLDVLPNADSGDVAEMLNTLFRSVHSIKGGAGAFNFSQTVEISHAMETCLDLLRSGKIQIDSRVLDALIEARDILADTIDSEKAGNKPKNENIGNVITSLLALQSDTGLAAAEGKTKNRPKENVSNGKQKKYVIKFNPTARLYEAANDPLLLVRELSSLGDLKTSADTNLVPLLSKMDPLDSYIHWEFELIGDVSFTDVEEVFEFVSDACALQIEEVSLVSVDKPGRSDTETVVTSEAESLAPAQQPSGLSLRSKNAPPPACQTHERAENYLCAR
ncbi:MAG: Hpt domain-containing protein [Rhodospirillales bacterium]|nr:Hpt domain-containing protein [Rhodospirillales bacterium]